MVYLDHNEFEDLLVDLLDCASFLLPVDVSAGCFWDLLKQAIRHLSLACTQLLSLLPSLDLSSVEADLANLQQTQTTNLAQHAGVKWCEQGEQSNSSLWDPVSGDLFSSMADMLGHARQFYQDLYTADPIDFVSGESLLNNIPSSALLSALSSASLLDKITLEEILFILNNTPSNSSPGLDGLPYPLWRRLFRHSFVQELAQQVYQDALFGVFPSSWLETVLVLLPKAGDPSLLKNWRPISLISCDAKIFTKIITSPLWFCLGPLITPYQTGFMANCFIADNGLLTRLVMQHAQLAKDPGVALLLDQEKAYDRVHLGYLHLVFSRFGFLVVFVDTVCSLFFGTKIHVNVNGFVSSPFPQGRGLRQGDPLSPLLFNLAFEPLLCTILASSSLRGFCFGVPPLLSAVVPLVPPPLLKLLAYADDLLVFLSCPGELASLLEILSVFGLASNARVNLSKTVAVALSGHFVPDWGPVLDASDISCRHDSHAVHAVRYLGFPLSSHPTQLDHFRLALLEKLERQCNIMSQRHLSVRDKSLVANSLLLSTLWHVLYVTSAPNSFFSALRRLVCGYLNLGFGSPGWDLLCQPRRRGGIGSLDPASQQKALQLRWIIPLLTNSSSSFSSSFVLSYLEFLLPLHFQAPSAAVALLFPCHLRNCPSSLRPIHRGCSPLSVSPIPLHVSMDAHTLLTLPLSAVWGFFPPFVASKLNFTKVFVFHAFEIDSLGRLCRKHISHLGFAKYRILSFFRALDSGQIVLWPWFLSGFVLASPTTPPSTGFSSLCLLCLLILLLQLCESISGIFGSPTTLTLFGGKLSGVVCPLAVECTASCLSDFLLPFACPVLLWWKTKFIFCFSVLGRGMCGVSFSLVGVLPGISRMFNL